MISKNQIKLIKQLEQKKHRQRQRLFVAEGPKVVGDLMRRSRPVAVYATEDYSPTLFADMVEHITNDELRKVSFLQHPQQVIALFPLPENELPAYSPSQLTLALDGVQDPGNLGTIIRLADWFGIDHIVCSEDTADAWNPKVVQATMGSIARIRLTYTNLYSFIQQLPEDTPVYGTLLDGENIYSQQLTPNGIIIMGNEGNGLSAEVRQIITHRLLIPNYCKGDTAESLNVAIATGIICAEFRRQHSLV